MRRSAALCASFILASCGISEPAPNAPAPELPKHSDQPLTSEPFLPTLSPHRLAVDGQIAVATDPEGPKSDGRAPTVWIAVLTSSAQAFAIRLPDGSNPAAVEIDAKTKTAWVVARGAGGVYAIDVTAKKIVQFLSTCPAPIDVASSAGTTWVACLGGEIAMIRDGAVKSVTALPHTLTSIAVDSTNKVFAGTSTGAVVQINGQVVRPETQPIPTSSRKLQADTARRLVAIPAGGVAMLYQQSVDGELTPPDPTTTVAPPGSYSGGPGPCTTPATRPVIARLQGDAFGGELVNPNGLVNDLAMSSDSRLAIVDAAAGQVTVVGVGILSLTSNGPCVPAFTPPLSEQRVALDSPIAAAFAGDGKLVVLAGAPQFGIRVFSPTTQSPTKTILLRTRELPAGFAIFHSRPNEFGVTNGITCASCHPDGRATTAVLKTDGVPRRVMALAGRVGHATKLHWDAQDFTTAITVGTWEQKMGGQPLNPVDAASLQTFIGQLRLPPSPVISDAARVAGEAAFAKAKCDTCHAPGHDFTNDSTADVGHGMHKVPSLRGLAYSAPYMSDGCASTIAQRFTWQACGGGDHHGLPSLLSNDETAALIEYLRSL